MENVKSGKIIAGWTSTSFECVDNSVIFTIVDCDCKIKKVVCVIENISMVEFIDDKKYAIKFLARDYIVPYDYELCTRHDILYFLHRMYYYALIDIKFKNYEYIDVNHLVINCIDNIVNIVFVDRRGMLLMNDIYYDINTFEKLFPKYFQDNIKIATSI